VLGLVWFGRVVLFFFFLVVFWCFFGVGIIFLTPTSVRVGEIHEGERLTFPLFLSRYFDPLFSRGISLLPTNPFSVIIISRFFPHPGNLMTLIDFPRVEYRQVILSFLFWAAENGYGLDTLRKDLSFFLLHKTPHTPATPASSPPHTFPPRPPSSAHRDPPPRDAFNSTRNSSPPLCLRFFSPDVL